MRAFCDTIHCRSRRHCRMCRDQEGGRPWRQALAEAFDLPGGTVDFACPDGLPWGGRSVPVAEKPSGHMTSTGHGCRTCGLTEEDRRRMAQLRRERGSSPSRPT